jgi:nitrate reductase (cytochrome), electron transfer subunit
MCRAYRKGGGMKYRINTIILLSGFIYFYSGFICGSSALANDATAEKNTVSEKNTAQEKDKALLTLKSAPAIADENAPPGAMRDSDNKDIKKSRAYPMQPPVIPHKVEGYQISKNANQCLSCHGRTRTQESQAPMVSVTHFMDRDGNFLADISARRYFCNQCHVPQQDSKLIFNNIFLPVDAIIAKGKGK